MTNEEAYNYLLGLLELEDDIRWPLVKESMDKFKELIDQQSILEEYNVTPEILREVLLTGQMFRNQPTLLECIKEWNEKGFDVDIYALEIAIHNHSTVKYEADEVEFIIDLLSKQVSMPKGCWAKLDFKIYHLLSKTLKALENNNETK